LLLAVMAALVETSTAVANALPPPTKTPPTTTPWTLTATAMPTTLFVKLSLI
jgi:hypothetical protein